MANDGLQLHLFLAAAVLVSSLIAAASTDEEPCLTEPCRQDSHMVLLPTWEAADNHFASLMNLTGRSRSPSQGSSAAARSPVNRQLLQFDSSSMMISNADRQEGRLLTRGCAVSLTMTISRGCAIISETIPYYYIDQVTR
jgi:hypothetical protein